MESSVSETVAFDCVCPDCHRAFDRGETECPDCGRAEPRTGWEPLADSSHPYLGHTIEGRYRLERYIGGGTAGEVYRARDLELDRPFALKVLDVPNAPERGELDKIRRRFRNEVEALSRIRNPHVVNIHEALTLEGGVPAMLMEYIEGPTLAEVLDSVDQLDLEQILVLAHQIANGLHEAHQRGVVHRDVKPANVIIERLPASGMFTRLLDFGLVHLVDDGGEGRGFRGTPLYAAPEQCRGTSEVSRAADIYSLGCMLFHLVAGRPPFDEGDVRSIIFSHVDERAPSLAEAAGRDVPEALDALVGRMLAKDPQQRPDDLSEVVGTLEELLREGEGWQSMAIAETGDALGPTTSEIAHRQTLDSESLRDNQFREHASDTPRLTQLIRFLELTDEFPELQPPVGACAVDLAGDCVAVADSGTGLFASNMRGRQFSAAFPTPDRRIVSLAVNSRTGRLIGGTAGGEFLRWQLAAPEREPSEVARRNRPVYTVALGGDRQRFYGIDPDGSLWMYDERVGRAEVLCQVPESIAHLQVSRDDTAAVAATLSGEVIVVRDLRSTPSAESVVHVGREPSALAFDGESGAVMVASDDGTLYSYRLEAGGGLEVSDIAVTHLRGLSITREAQVLGLSVRGTTAQTWRIRHERLQNVFDWLGARETTGRSVVSPSLIEEDPFGSPGEGS